MLVGFPAGLSALSGLLVLVVPALTVGNWRSMTIHKDTSITTGTAPSPGDALSPSYLGSGSERVSIQGYVHQGCRTTPAKGGPDKFAVIGGDSISSDKLTLERCATYCAAFTYFGVENGRQCLCGNMVSPLTADAAGIECTQPCSGNAAETCGGERHVDVYRTATVTTATAQTIGRSVSTHMGCFTETGGVGGAGRTLSGYSNAGAQMDLTRCARVCREFRYWGVQYAVECYCGDQLAAGARRVFNDECGMRCSGEAEELCGGVRRLAVYHRENRYVKQPSWTGDGAN